MTRHGLGTIAPDVAAALRALGVVARTVRSVTGLLAPRTDRAAFRVVAHDGRILKVRRLSREPVARRYVGLVRALRHLPLPVILTRQGRVTVETWIKGIPLSELSRTFARLRTAADVLGALHATRVLRGRRVRGVASPRPFVGDLVRRLEVLRNAGALTTGEGEHLRRELERRCPRRAAIGLTHNDFCAANLVEDAAGHLFVVDNGGLRPGFLDFDLARSWYRWPMPARAWRVFLARYGTWRRVVQSPEAVAFWRTAAIVRSAHFRVRHGSPAAEEPLRRLRRLARDL